MFGVYRNGMKARFEGEGFFHVGRVNGTIEKERILWRKWQCNRERKEIFCIQEERKMIEEKGPFRRCLPSLWLERIWYFGLRRRCVTLVLEEVHRTFERVFSTRRGRKHSSERGRTHHSSKNKVILKEEKIIFQGGVSPEEEHHSGAWEGVAAPLKDKKIHNRTIGGERTTTHHQVALVSSQ
ncbi:hypothetical protein AAG906_012466 [Vitis piasezkii]